MNKALLKAAAIFNIAAASLIYVSCSGDDGAKGDPGKDGIGCTAAASLTVPGGIDITCGGVSAGTLQPGNPGATGPVGPQGPGGGTGPGGEFDGCYLTPAATGGYNVTCGGVDQGPLVAGGAGGGCSIGDIGDYYQFVCPPGGAANTYLLAKAWCNYYTSTGIKLEAYDPTQGVCNIGSPGTSTGGIETNCGGLGYLRSQQFCGKDAEGEDKIYARCGALYNDVNELGQSADSLGLYNPATEFCLKKSANTLYAIGNSSGQVNGNTNLSDGEKKTLCQASWQGGRYSDVDFCHGTGEAARVYLKCNETTVTNVNGVKTINRAPVTFNPTTQFCQPSGTAVASQVPGTSVYDGRVKPRCGTDAIGGGASLTGFGAGTYDSLSFCSPLTSRTVAAANAKQTKKCIGGVDGTLPATGSIVLGVLGTVTQQYPLIDYIHNGTKFTNVISAAPVSQTVYGDGEYNTNTSKCVLSLVIENATPPTYVMEVPTIAARTPCGSALTALDEQREFCGPGNVVYPICETKGTAGLDANQSEATDYDVTKRFCDVRGQELTAKVELSPSPATISGTASTSGATGTVTAGGFIEERKVSGGKLYSYTNLGGKNWMAQDLVLSKGTGANSGIVHGIRAAANGTTEGLSTFTWVEANSAVSLCPAGWRMPTEADWTALQTAADPYTGQKLRVDATVNASVATSPWLAASSDPVYSTFAAIPSQVRTAATGKLSDITTSKIDLHSNNEADVAKFCVTKGGALSEFTDNSKTPPVTSIGCYKTTGSAGVLANDEHNVWWSAGELDQNNGHVRFIRDGELAIGAQTYNKVLSYFSVRCVKD